MASLTSHSQEERVHPSSSLLCPHQAWAQNKCVRTTICPVIPLFCLQPLPLYWFTASAFKSTQSVFTIQKTPPGTSLETQWLRLCSSNAGGPGQVFFFLIQYPLAAGEVGGSPLSTHNDVLLGIPSKPMSMTRPITFSCPARAGSHLASLQAITLVIQTVNLRPREGQRPAQGHREKR